MNRIAQVCAVATLTACGSYSNGGMGVTPGGSQDIGVARDLIDGGQVPHADHYTAEGLFSEHDLPLTGDPCTELLCPRADATVHRPLDGRADRMLVQLGFGTSIDLATFERDALDVAALVDTSCSMSGEKLDLAKDALRRMVGQLGEDDHMALVEFGSTAKVRESSRRMDGAGRDRMLDAIDALHTNGSTDMESGMRKGYDQLDPNLSGQHRLMVFTDAQPNTGVTEESEFVQLVRDQSAAGVGTTVFGTGTDLGSELADAIARVRGGSYHYVGADDAERLFVDEFDLIVTPVAYDLEMHLVGRGGLEVDEIYGAPVDDGEVELGASTLFLSKRGGGIGATFAALPEDGVTEMPIGTMSVSYVPVGETAPVQQSLDVGWYGGLFLAESDGLGVHKLGGLIDEYLALRAASAWCEGGDDPTAVIDATIDRLDEMGAQLEDTPITAEADLMRKLRDNVAIGLDACAEGDLYYY